jgi:hypothetical protein
VAGYAADDGLLAHFDWQLIRRSDSHTEVLERDIVCRLSNTGLIAMALRGSLFDLEAGNRLSVLNGLTAAPYFILPFPDYNATAASMPSSFLDRPAPGSLG